MIFEAFFKSITSPALRKVAAHWGAARGGRTVPAWKDIKPAGMAGQLSMVWVFEYDRESGEFIGRIAGERIFGGAAVRKFRGTPLRDFHAADHYPRVLEHALYLVREPALAIYSGTLFRQRDRLGTGERIVMPLSSDGVACDAVLGASDYVFPVTNPDYGPIEVLIDGERFFSLRPEMAGSAA